MLLSLYNMLNHYNGAHDEGLNASGVYTRYMCTEAFCPASHSEFWVVVVVSLFRGGPIKCSGEKSQKET